MAGAVLHKGDELARAAAQLRCHFVNEIADKLDDMDIGPFVMAADVIRFAHPAAREHEPEGFGVVPCT